MNLYLRTRGHRTEGSRAALLRCDRSRHKSSYEEHPGGRPWSVPPTTPWGRPRWAPPACWRCARAPRRRRSSWTRIRRRSRWWGATSSSAPAVRLLVETVPSHVLLAHQLGHACDSQSMSRPSAWCDRRTRCPRRSGTCRQILTRKDRCPRSRSSPFSRTVRWRPTVRVWLCDACAVVTAALCTRRFSLPAGVVLAGGPRRSAH